MKHPFLPTLVIAALCLPVLFAAQLARAAEPFSQAQTTPVTAISPTETAATPPTPQPTVEIIVVTATSKPTATPVPIPPPPDPRQIDTMIGLVVLAVVVVIFGVWINRDR
jgi:hypothetical protein